MSEPVFKVDYESFKRSIEKVQKESGRSRDEMLKYVMILMLQAGRSATPQGRKNRALIKQEADKDSSDNDSPDQPTGRFYQVYHQGSHIPQKVFVPVIPRKTKTNSTKRDEAIKARDAIVSKFKRINYRGAAKASWSWAMKMLNAKQSIPGAAQEMASSFRRNPIEITKESAVMRASITVTNKLGWIRKISPDIEQRIMKSADSRLQSWLERRWKSNFEKAGAR